MENNKRLIEVLNKAIQDSNQWFEDESKSHATIIGYLQGTIKAAIMDLELKDWLAERKQKLGGQS